MALPADLEIKTENKARHTKKRRKAKSIRYT
jgi:hypothetical protein